MARDDDDDRDAVRGGRPDGPRRRPPGEDADEDDRPRRRRRDEDDDDDRPRRRPSSDDGGVGYVIPYKNAPALISYYVGVFGLIACLFGLGLFTGSAAVILGILGMVRASRNPEAHGRAHAIVGMILGAVQMLSGCAVVAWIVIGIMGEARR